MWVVVPDPALFQSIERCTFGEKCRIERFVNLFDCRFGHECQISAFVEAGGATVGDRVKIMPFAALSRGNVIEDEVFVGPYVCFANHPRPRATLSSGHKPIIVRRGVTIGSTCVILGGVEIGEGAIIGAGSVITKSVPAGSVVYGPKAQVWKG